MTFVSDRHPHHCSQNTNNTTTQTSSIPMADDQGEMPLEEEGVEEAEEEEEADDSDEDYVEDSGDEQSDSSSSSSEDEDDEEDPYVYMEGDALPSFESAMYLRRPLSVIRAIVEQQQQRNGNPNFLVRRVCKKKIPLHAAIEQKGSFQLIRYLVRLNPKTVKIRTGDKVLPLHLALTKRHPGKTIRFLVSQWPKSAALPFEHSRRFALQYALLGDARPFGMGTLRCLIRAWPEVLREGGDEDGLPLHMFLEGGVYGYAGTVTAEYVAAFVEPYPDALQERNVVHGLLPLHAAASNKYLPLDVLQYLVARRPVSIREWAPYSDFSGNSAREGRLAIHLALEARSPPERIRFFLEVWPGSIRRKDAEGNLPVHVAIKNNVPPKTVRLVVQAWPDSVRERDNGGSLPVHLAAAKRSPAKVRLLVEQWPESVSAVDGSGATPLHRAFEHRSVPGVVQFLVDRSPGALGAADDRGRLPLHLAAYPPTTRETFRCTSRSRGTGRPGRSAFSLSSTPTPSFTEMPPGCCRSRWRCHNILRRWTLFVSLLSRGQNHCKIRTPTEEFCFTLCWRSSTPSPSRALTTSIGFLLSSGPTPFTFATTPDSCRCTSPLRPRTRRWILCTALRGRGRTCCALAAAPRLVRASPHRTGPDPSSTLCTAPRRKRGCDPALRLTVPRRSRVG
jgi:hypothetical protein